MNQENGYGSLLSGYSGINFITLYKALWFR